MKKSWVITGLSLAVILGVLVQLAIAPKDIEKDLKAQYLEGGNFALKGIDGEVSLNQFSGQPVILYFGFTFCPDICPIGLSVIKDAIAQNDQFSQFKVLFVTVDPDRDTSQRLQEYLSFFNPAFIGLTGSIEQITAVAKRYGTYFAKAPADEEGEYSVDHTAYFYLIDQNGELVRVLDHDTDANSLASILEQLI